MDPCGIADWAYNKHIHQSRKNPVLLQSPHFVLMVPLSIHQREWSDSCISIYNPQSIIKSLVSHDILEKVGGWGLVLNWRWRPPFTSVQPWGEARTQQPNRWLSKVPWRLKRADNQNHGNVSPKMCWLSVTLINCSLYDIYLLQLGHLFGWLVAGPHKNYCRKILPELVKRHPICQILKGYIFSCTSVQRITTNFSLHCDISDQYTLFT